MGTHLKSWSVGVLTGAFCHLHRTKPEDSSDEDEKESMAMPTFVSTYFSCQCRLLGRNLLSLLR